MNNDVILLSGGSAIGLRSTLASLGYEARHTRTMEEAIEAARSSETSSFMMDRDVTDEDGLEFVLNIREFRPRTPILIVTGFWQALDHAIAMLPNVRFVHPSEKAIRQEFQRLAA